MTKSYRTRVYELALANHGVVTTTMATANNIPAVELRKLASRGAITRVAQGVYRSPFHPADTVSKFREALEIAGPGSFLVGESVLALLEMAGFTEFPIKVGATMRVRKALPEGLKITRFGSQPELEEIRGLPCESVTSVLRQQRERLTPGSYAALAMQLRRFDKDLQL